MSRVKLGLALSVIAVCAGVFLAGGSNAAILDNARQATLGERSARVAVELGAPDGTSPDLRAAGVVDLESGTGELNLEGGATGPAEIRLVGPSAYIRSAGLELGNRPWVRVDLNGPPGGEDMSAVSGLDLVINDPRRLVDLLAGGKGEVENLGEVQVRGELTTRYRASVDPAEAEATLEGAPRRAFESFSRRIGEEVTVEVWIDERGRARRIALNPGPAGGGSQDPTGASVSVEFFDFGAPADVKAPPESEVTIFGGTTG